ncbi:TetR/AcrR family transcriptional regulator [Aquihabitans daechungensis]|uniref:TetR/AcrR family transcriptional regulator n=1 Tax=Aquihabitans daechungensis TaxID=1052257 RepID=UPI003BA1A415
MAQVQKPEVRARILAAGRRSFFEHGYDATTMAAIAREAGVATANIYRYVPDKAALFEAVLPDALIAEHDALLDARVAALTRPIAPGDPADELLRFWIQHRWEVATLLDHEGATSRSSYRHDFVARLVDHVEATLPTPLDPTARMLVELVFDNTRLAIASILRRSAEPEEIRCLIAGFWSYQLPGLDGLLGWVRDHPSPSTPA